MTAVPPTPGVNPSPTLPLFPHATGAPLEPITQRELRARRIASWRRDHPVLRWGLWIALIAGGILAAMGSLGYGGVSIAVLVIWLLLYTRHSSAAADELFAAYAHPRGLLVTGKQPDMPYVLPPLLKRGDERTISRSVSGAFAGTTGVLAHYTYTKISVDSEGNQQRHDYPFTVLLMKLHQLVGARYSGVYLRAQRISTGGLFDTFTADRHVELESAEFERRYTLRVADEQDDIALFELMNPPFIQHLVDAPEIDGETVQFEQQADDLLVYVRTHLKESSALDQLVMSAAHIYLRFSQEYQ